MNRFLYLALLLTWGSVGFCSDSGVPKPGEFTYDRASGLLMIRVPEADADRGFLPIVRITFADGSEAYSSVGCFPIDYVEKGTSPVGSSQISLHPTPDGITVTSAEMIWTKRSGERAPFTGSFEKRFRDLEARGGQILAFKPGVSA